MDYRDGLTQNSATSVVTVAGGTLTLSDSVDLPQFVRAIRVKVAGLVKITCFDGALATLEFEAGETRDVFARRIWSSVTTATGIEGMV